MFIRRPRPPRRAAVVLALLMGCVLAAPGGAAAEAADPSGDARAGALQPLAPGARQVAWAKAQRTADRARRKHPPKVTPIRFKGPRGPVPLAAGDEPTSTLVLYDTTGPYGHLGELYAMATANLAGHFGTVTTKPVSDYTAAEVEQHTATIYIGSTYYGGSIPDAIPDAFYADVATTTRKVVWINDNVWNLAGKIGISTFAARYGWDPTSSFFDPVGGVTQVDYKTRPLTRTVPAAGDGGILRPHILTGTGFPAVTTLAEANDTSTSPATRFPWAIRSSNLTYLGEIPYSYVKETDRVIAWHDLLFDALAPDTPERHRAILRLEDISPKSDPDELMSVATYLAEQRIPYAFQVIPVYTDPNGHYNNGIPETVPLSAAPEVISALNYMLANGGHIVGHGYTHQYGSVANPYNGSSGDDFEFYRAHVDAGDNVIYDGPVPEDSATWAAGRLTAGKSALEAAGMPMPSIWTTPHYAASAVDYGVFKEHYAARLERSLYFKGVLSGGTIDSQTYIGQFFPYPVKDVYGATVLPENLGNYEPEAANNHPPRPAADIVKAAQYNLAVRDGFASTFFHPYYPLTALQEIVTGIRDLGYTFVDPETLI